MVLKAKHETWATVFKQFRRYLVTAGLGWIADLGTFLGLSALLQQQGMARVWAVNSGHLAGFTLGLVINYVLSVKWVFDNRRLSSKKAEFAFFGAIGIGGLLVSAGLLNLGVSLLGMTDFWGKIFATAGALAFNFTARKFALFSGGK